MSSADNKGNTTLVRLHYFLVFEVISQIWHIEIRPNLHILSVIYLSSQFYDGLNFDGFGQKPSYLSPSLYTPVTIRGFILSGKFKENLIVGSRAMCLGTATNYQFGYMFCV